VPMIVIVPMIIRIVAAGRVLVVGLGVAAVHDRLSGGMSWCRGASPRVCSAW
jgi:hypothetical protein